jgi:hypothetical protein
VGIAIIIVAAVKYALVSTSIPTVYIWCAHTIKPNTPMDSKAKTIPVYPKILDFPEYTGIISEIIPKAGSISIYTSG